MRGPVLAAWRAKARFARNSLGRAWRRSALRVACIGGVALVLCLGGLFLLERAFAFLHEVEVVGPVLVARLLSLLFFILFVMLVMSNCLVAFQTLYRSREAEFWLLTPLRAESVFDVRSLEIALIASWAFLVLGTPLVLAYGVGTGARGLFYALLPIVLLLFVAIAHDLGTLAVIVVVRAFPGIDLKRLIALLVAALVPVGWALVRAFRIGAVRDDADGTDVLVQTLQGLGRSQYPVLPGYWASEALHAAQLGEAGRALFFTWTLAITAAFFHLLARAAAGRWLVPGCQLLRGAGVSRPAFPRTRRRGRGPARGPLRALAIKDVKLFFREPAQWSQVGLVALLGLVYVVNLRNLPDLSRFALWGNVASYLNLAVLLLLMATLTTRFAFPLISMEGRRAWIVMLAPLPRPSILRQKLLVALPLAITVGEAAAIFSTITLGVASSVRVVTHVAVAAAAVALSGLAIGLGALFPNFREDNPARIVSGFGGTLSFLLGLAYVATATLLLGAPSVLAALGRLAPPARHRLDVLGIAAVLALSLVVAAVPLALGRKRLAALEL